jgi:hypothetical protein
MTELIEKRVGGHTAVKFDEAIRPDHQRSGAKQIGSALGVGTPRPNRVDRAFKEAWG